MVGNPQNDSCGKRHDHMVEEPNTGTDKKVAVYHRGVVVGLKIFHKHRLNR